MWLGIDFGTSNSSAARLVGGHPHPVREPISHQPLFPSCVLLVPPDGNIERNARLITGVGAERRMLLFPDRTVSHRAAHRNAVRASACDGHRPVTRYNSGP